MVKVQTKYVCEIENIGWPYKREGRSAEREEEWGRPQKQTLAALSTKEAKNSYTRQNGMKYQNAVSSSCSICIRYLY